MGSQTDSVIPFAPAARSASADGVDQLDKAGQTILGLLHTASGNAGGYTAVKRAARDIRPEPITPFEIRFETCRPCRPKTKGKVE
jgi:hypothetical protein